MCLGDVLDLNPRRLGQFPGARANRIAQRLGKARIVENPNAAGIKKRRHALRIARSRQRARTTIRS
ncbi:hypothetical protein NB231_05250 [Nitrococcus mobilis Nb-231]|uniref:Uncharacterized protein n=1 Tax=Nitrococcus mobilis Nb-231 TaxID=314278 RepID=A4BQD4_9GAMM|nr:hypothetical protein NB231_05250 [Nitrococcus mobilis Nb-231]